MASQRQRSLRYKWWRGFAVTLALLTGWALAQGLADRITNGAPL